MSANPQNDQAPVSVSSSTQSTQPPVVYFQGQPPLEEDDINLLDYWRVLMRYKWMIILITIISGASAISAAFLMTPIYRAEVVLAPAGEDKNAASALSGQFGGLAALAGINLGGGGGEVEQAIATLESRVFTNEFISQEKLMPVLFEDKWDESSSSWIVKTEEEIPTLWDAYKKFGTNIRSVSVDKKSGMYTLSIEWSDPELTYTWANKLVEKINSHQKKAAIIEAQKSIAYLENQLKETSVVEMQQAIYRLIEAQTKNIMLANVRDEFVFKVIDPAVLPEEKIKPKKKLIAILGVIVGFMLSVFLAFLLAFIRKQKEVGSNVSAQTGDL